MLFLFKLRDRDCCRYWEAVSLIVLGIGLSLAMQSLAASTGDVVINEVAWMGTGSAPALCADEWIELYNTTENLILLAGWGIFEIDVSGEETLVEPLSGTIGAYSYYLVERTDDETVKDIFADQPPTGWGGNGLDNGGEHLILKDARGNIIDEINASSKWFAGQAAPNYLTMERVNPTISGNESGNWRSNNPAIAQNGMDADSNPLNGTPKAQNSATNLPTADFTFVPEQPTTWDAVQFSDQSSDADGAVIAWAWAFGDGGTSIETNPTHWYELPGTYRATLEVSDNDGLIGLIFKDVLVSLGPGDVDGSGVLDVLDVRIVLQAALGLITLSQDQVLQADVGGDGEVTKTDAQRLSAHIIGIRE